MRTVFPYSLLFALLFLLAACDSSGANEEKGLNTPSLATPLPGATTEDAVLLKWNAVQNVERYHVQLARSNSFSDPILDRFVSGNTQIIANELAMNTSYFWRVRSISDSSQGDWSTIRTFTPTSVATLPGMPSLSLPDNGTQDLERSLKLEWDEVKNAVSYHLVVTMDQEMLLFQADLENIEDLFFEIDGLIYTYPYWWKVRALGPAGYSEWSPVWIFHIQDNPQ